MARARYPNLDTALDTALALATVEAVETLRDVMRRGGQQDRTAAAKHILDRTIPIPKTTAVQVVTGASAVDGGRLEALAKVRARSLLESPDSTDATFTPLARVQTGE